MGISFYDHQLEAIEKLHNGCVLCGGVGSGKSRTAIGYYFLKVCQGQLCINGEGKYKRPTKPKDLYIITTARKRDTLEWEGELPPFLLSTDSDISVCGINVTVDSWNNIHKYVNIRNAFVIFDEQRVIGYGAWSKSFIHICRQNEWILLSATPGDTWMDYMSIFIANGFYRNKTDFVQQHVIYSRFAKYNKVERYVSEGKLIRLRRDILVTMDYSKPTISHHENYKVDYDRYIYNAIMSTRWDYEKDAPIKNASELFYLLRKIVNSDPSRCETIGVILETHPKAIVFYNFDYELSLLKAFASFSDIPYAEWNGHRHEPIPNGENWLYLVQYTAGAEGWNCITTDTVIFYSENYSYKVMVQSAGRVDRMNTPYRELYYYHLLSNSPIDRGINLALKKKKNFNEKMFYDKLSSREKNNDYDERKRE